MEFSEISEYVDGIAEVFRENDAPIDPLPKIVLDDRPQEEGEFSGPFIRTGHYQPDDMVVTVYTHGRHLKDILRSLTHELVHHSQNLADEDLLQSNTDGSLVTNPNLMKIEADAYLRGNIYFREWTEKFAL